MGNGVGALLPINQKRNGAYVLYPDGRGYWRNWATDGELNAWSDAETSHANPIDFAAIERQRIAERKSRIEAIKGAREAWNKAGQLRSLHPYLERVCLHWVAVVCDSRVTCW